MVKLNKNYAVINHNLFLNICESENHAVFNIFFALSVCSTILLTQNVSSVYHAPS